MLLLLPFLRAHGPQMFCDNCKIMMSLFASLLLPFVSPFPQWPPPPFCTKGCTCSKPSGRDPSHNPGSLPSIGAESRLLQPSLWQIHPGGFPSWLHPANRPTFWSPLCCRWPPSRDAAGTTESWTTERRSQGSVHPQEPASK